MSSPTLQFIHATSGGKKNFFPKSYKKSVRHFRCIHGATERGPTAYFRVIRCDDVALKVEHAGAGIINRGCRVASRADSVWKICAQKWRALQQPSRFASFNPFARLPFVSFQLHFYMRPVTINFPIPRLILFWFFQLEEIIYAIRSVSHEYTKTVQVENLILAEMPECQ